MKNLALSIKQFLALVFWLTAFSHLAFASDHGTVAFKVAKSLGYKRPTESGDFDAFAVSRVWPDDRSKMIVALAYPSSETKDESALYDLDVLVVDSATLRVVARLTQKDAITSDAVYLSGLSIYTTPYQVAKGVRAFGIQESYSGSSRVNPFSCTTMGLYIVSGKKLLPVLRSMVMTTTTGEWDGNCEGHFSDTGRTISIGETATKGYRDLIVEGRVTEQKNVPSNNGGCISKVTEGTPEKFVLKFDGSEYVVPKNLRFDD